MGAFRFKQFEVVQDHSAMKVNTDAVLLGAWVRVPDGCARTLDVGTGTGVIALMVGQRIAAEGCIGNGAGIGYHPCEIHAVEIDSGACKDAAANFASAPWQGISFHLHEKPLQKFATENYSKKYNLIVSNPPYFISSLKNSSESKTIARHTDTLSQRELLFHSTALLEEGGIFAVILPVAEGEELLRKVEFMIQAAIAAHSTSANGTDSTDGTNVTGYAMKTSTGQPVLFPSRICYIYTVEHKPAKRLMLEFVKCHPSVRPVLQCEQLVMMDRGSYTPEYSSLVGKFYLWG